MPPISASKAARLEKKAAKASAKGGSTNGTSTTASSTTGTPATGTPLTNVSAATSTEDLNDMNKLKIAFDRSGSGVMTSDAQSRDIQAINYTLSFHGRVLIESGNLTLNYGQR